MRGESEVAEFEGAVGTAPTDTELERTILSVPGVAAASVHRHADGRSRLRLRLHPGEDAESVSWAIAATLRERFAIALDPKAIRQVVDDPATGAADEAMGTADDPAGAADTPMDAAGDPAGDPAGAADTPMDAPGAPASPGHPDGPPAPPTSPPTPPTMRAGPDPAASPPGVDDPTSPSGRPDERTSPTEPPVTPDDTDESPGDTDEPPVGTSPGDSDEPAVGTSAADTDEPPAGTSAGKTDELTVDTSAPPSLSEPRSEDPIRPLGPEVNGASGQLAPRATIHNLDVEWGEAGVRVTATLGHAGRRADGSASAVATSIGLRRAVAEATVSAMRSLLGGSLLIGIDHVTVRSGDDPALATAVLTWLTDRGEETLVGTSLLRADPERAVMRATLDALNRRVEPLLVGDAHLPR